MTFGELDMSQLHLGNHISLLTQVVLLVLRSYMETSIALSVICLMRLCVVLCKSGCVEARYFCW